MVNNNDLINLVNNKKPVELVQELEKYEIKKSPLSVAARSKVINKEVKIKRIMDLADIEIVLIRVVFI